jgi:chemotaxis protein methyltransferase CheR
MEYAITAEEFQRFRTLIYDESGISLSEQKHSLLASRLSKRLRDLDLATFSEYYAKVMEDQTREEFTRMLDLISTNKTDFFREPKHFDFLRERILPELNSAKRIRIWSSACSTGEAPYTIAMTSTKASRIPNGGISKYLPPISRLVSSPRPLRAYTTKIVFTTCRPTS